MIKSCSDMSLGSIAMLAHSNPHEILMCLISSRSILHGPNGQSLSSEDVLKAGALDSPSGLDFSGDTHPVNIVCLATQWHYGHCDLYD